MGKVSSFIVFCVRCCPNGAANGDIYEGSWSCGQKHGAGTHYFVAQNRRYDGVWSSDTPKCGLYGDIEGGKPVLKATSMPSVIKALFSTDFCSWSLKTQWACLTRLRWLFRHECRLACGCLLYRLVIAF
jgi:hypothetical protein